MVCVSERTVMECCVCLCTQWDNGKAWDRGKGQREMNGVCVSERNVMECCVCLCTHKQISSLLLRN